MSATRTAAVATAAAPAHRRGRGLGTALATGGAVAVATLVVHLNDPNEPGSYGICPLRLTTGLLCPFCGATRAVHAMTHGEWGQAMDLNPLVTLLTPLTVLAWGIWALRAARGRHTDFLDRVGAVWALIIAMVVFGVLRNVPALQPHLALLT